MFLMPCGDFQHILHGEGHNEKGLINIAQTLTLKTHRLPFHSSFDHLSFLKCLQIFVEPLRQILFPSTCLTEKLK